MMRTASDTDSSTDAGTGSGVVSLVIPLYNEEEVIPELVARIEAFRAGEPSVGEIVLVDDGSTDATASLVRRHTEGLQGYVLVRFSRNFGHQLAVTAGLHVASGDAAVILDADGQDPLPVVTQMIARWREGYDVVYGVRRSRHADTWLQRSTARLFYRFFQRFTEVDAPMDAGDFRLVSRAVIDAYDRLAEQQPYVRGLISWLGFNQVGVEYDRPARAAGRSKYSWGDRMRLALDGLSSFSARPLRYAVRIGLLTSLIALVGLLWVVVTKVTGQTVPGWASLTFVAFFFGGLQLFFLGVVGSYVGRVYEEVKGRPRYIVRERWRSRPQGQIGEAGIRREDPAYEGTTRGLS